MPARTRDFRPLSQARTLSAHKANGGSTLHAVAFPALPSGLTATPSANYFNTNGNGALLALSLFADLNLAVFFARPPTITTGLLVRPLLPEAHLDV